ncbi:hypothetical protein [Streptomyces sp. NBC_01244]|uniref:hypothetical protein n=1 Tax=Streptomyces sp. NBC_01244 TaxID=2903797 RepID=UPI002E11B96F|nr:hypothetical protein OG247_43825 [Streptomyces sp. NBC_01244]
MSTADYFGHEPAPRIGKRVRDIASGSEGQLMAVVQEEVPNYEGRPMTVWLAYIRLASGGRELSTAPTNLEVVR